MRRSRGRTPYLPGSLEGQTSNPTKTGQGGMASFADTRTPGSSSREKLKSAASRYRKGESASGHGVQQGGHVQPRIELGGYRRRRFRDCLPSSAGRQPGAPGISGRRASNPAALPSVVSGAKKIENSCNRANPARIMRLEFLSDTSVSFPGENACRYQGRAGHPDQGRGC